MKEKQSYSEAKLDIVYLDDADIITASGDGWLTNDGKPNYDPNGWI